MSRNATGASSRGRWIKTIFKTALGLAAICAFAFVALLALNAVDDDLSAEAKALLAPPQMGKVEDGNGFIAFLGMGAPRDQDQMDWGRKAAAAYMAQAQPGFKSDEKWKEATRSHIDTPPFAGKPARKPWCLPEARDCLAEARRDGAALDRLLAEADNALLLARYRRVREGAGFVDLYIGTDPAASMPRFGSLLNGALLAQADIARKAGAGELEAAVAELEREVAFHRKIIAQSGSLIGVMIGNRLLSRDLLAISELLRGDPGAAAAYRERLAALTRPQVNAAVLKAAFALEAHSWASFGLEIRKVLRDNRGWMLSDNLTGNVSPVVNWLRSLLALPNQTANRAAALSAIDAAMADAPASQFDARAREIRAAKADAAGGAEPWYARLRNPVGKAFFGDPVNLDSYAARMHDLHALERMVDLQLALAARGLTDPAAMAAYIAGEGAQSHSDPYTGKAFSFDPGKRLLSFEPRAKGSWSADLKKRNGTAGIVI